MSRGAVVLWWFVNGTGLLWMRSRWLQVIRPSEFAYSFIQSSTDEYSTSMLQEKWFPSFHACHPWLSQERLLGQTSSIFYVFSRMYICHMGSLTSKFTNFCSFLRVEAVTERAIIWHRLQKPAFATHFVDLFSRIAIRFVVSRVLIIIESLIKVMSGPQRPMYRTN